MNHVLHYWAREGKCTICQRRESVAAEKFAPATLAAPPQRRGCQTTSCCLKWISRLLSRFTLCALFPPLLSTSLGYQKKDHRVFKTTSLFSARSSRLNQMLNNFFLTLCGNTRTNHTFDFNFKKISSIGSSVPSQEHNHNGEPLPAEGDGGE